jgi:hypothetical protein
VDVEGNVVVTDHDNLLVRKIFQGGIVSTITGSVREGNRIDFWRKLCKHLSLSSSQDF